MTRKTPARSDDNLRGPTQPHEPANLIRPAKRIRDSQNWRNCAEQASRSRSSLPLVIGKSLVLSIICNAVSRSLVSTRDPPNTCGSAALVVDRLKRADLAVPCAAPFSISMAFAVRPTGHGQHDPQDRGHQRRDDHRPDHGGGGVTDHAGRRDHRRQHQQPVAAQPGTPPDPAMAGTNRRGPWLPAVCQGRRRPAPAGSELTAPAAREMPATASHRGSRRPCRGVSRLARRAVKCRPIWKDAPAWSGERAGHHGVIPARPLPVIAHDQVRESHALRTSPGGRHRHRRPSAWALTARPVRRRRAGREHEPHGRRPPSPGLAWHLRAQACAFGLGDHPDKMPR
jgi:hypothetical protein